MSSVVAASSLPAPLFSLPCAPHPGEGFCARERKRLGGAWEPGKKHRQVESKHLPPARGLRINTGVFLVTGVGLRAPAPFQEAAPESAARTSLPRGRTASAPGRLGTSSARGRKRAAAWRPRQAQGRGAAGHFSTITPPLPTFPPHRTKKVLAAGRGGEEKGQEVKHPSPSADHGPNPEAVGGVRGCTASPKCHRHAVKHAHSTTLLMPGGH